MTNDNLIPLPSLARTLDERENELPEVIDLLSSGQIERDDPRLDYAYHVAGNVGKTLRSWTYDDIQAAYDRINGDNPPSIGDLTFYAEPAQVGRFIVGMGEVHGGDGSPRITIAGATGEPGLADGTRGALYLTEAEAREIGEQLLGMVADADGVGGDPA